MLLPLYMKRRGIALPEPGDEETRYILADNGVFLERRSPMFVTSIRISQYDLDLEVHHEYCQLTCGKIPHVMHRAMLGFFKYAHEVHGGEAALVLLFHPEKNTFRWHCPEQVVEVYRTCSGWTTAPSIEFRNPIDLPAGYVHFGDAHSHADTPTPSTVDVRDDQDGLHIIVGTIGSVPSYHIVFVMDGVRFRVAPEAIFEDPRCQPFGRPPRRWLRQVRLRSSRETAAKEPSRAPKPADASLHHTHDDGRPR
jgi:hypothetical protein